MKKIPNETLQQMLRPPSKWRGVDNDLRDIAKELLLARACVEMLRTHKAGCPILGHMKTPLTEYDALFTNEPAASESASVAFADSVAESANKIGPARARAMLAAIPLFTREQNEKCLAYIFSVHRNETIFKCIERVRTEEDAAHDAEHFVEVLGAFMRVENRRQSEDQERS